jgi:hypothetical protein
MLFKTYDYQDQLLDDFNDYRFNIINKGRQLGISTITAGYIVWMMLFHRDKWQPSSRQQATWFAKSRTL